MSRVIGSTNGSLIELYDQIKNFKNYIYKKKKKKNVKDLNSKQ